MALLYTEPDSLPYPQLSSFIGNTANAEDIQLLLQQLAVKTQAALTSRDSTTIQMAPDADNMDLNDLRVIPRDLAFRRVTSFDGALNLPPEFSGVGITWTWGTDNFNVVQYLNGRDQNTTWSRTCADAGVTPAVWSPWKSDVGALPSANGRDLNTMFQLKDFGVHDVTHNGGALNLPAGFSGRGTVQVVANTRFTVAQILTSREQNVTWKRVCQNAGATPAVWSEWILVHGPKQSLPSQLAVGDSLGNLLGSNVGDTMPGISVSGRGWNGETSDGINIRLGAKRTIWTVTGGSIPASGPVAITTDMALDLSASSTYYTGHLHGVDGRIDWDVASQTYSFTRAAAGTAVPASGKVRFEPRWTAQVQFMTPNITMGRNDLSTDAQGADASVVDHIKANYLELTDWFSAENMFFTILGTLNRTTEPVGHPNHTRILELEQWWRDTFPGHWLPWRRYIIDQVIYDLGITPTAEDLANMANDCPPPSIMTDITHPKPEAATMTWRKLIRPWQLAKGWY